VALVDLKSDLSKWRRPVEKPLVDSPRQETPKKVNQTPLSELIEGLSSPQRPGQTATKSGVTPKPYNNTEKFKGETDVKPLERTEKFLGETSPTLYSQVEKFKGETTPTLYSQVEKFKGETTPTKTTLKEKFKGETTPTIVDQTEKFKGETDTTNITQGDRFKGETTPQGYSNVEKFKGETDPTTFKFDPNLEQQGKDYGIVDFFTNLDAVGFTPKIDTTSKFVGVNPAGTIFDSTTSIRALKDTPVAYKTSLQLDNGLGKSYTDSLLKDTYNGKTNKSGGNAHGLLRQDSFNTWVIRQPFIVTGIQDGKGKEFNYGIGGLSFIRGGAVTSTVRAAFDAARISQFLLTPRGIVWALKQVGMQRSQRWGKVWTPTNLLTTIAGQHIGFRPDRQGVFPGDDRGRYTSGKILNLYNQIDFTGAGLPFATSTDVRGGFGSVYGIGVTTTTRSNQNTFGNTFTFEIGASTYQSKLPIGDDKLTFGVINQTLEQSPIPIDTKNENKPNLLKSEGFSAGAPDIGDYEFLSYGKIKKRAEGYPTTAPTDFRDLYDSGTKKDLAANLDYKTENIHNVYGIPTPLPVKDVKTLNATKATAFDISVDTLNNKVFNAPGTVSPDYVTLFFAYDNRGGAQNGQKIIQFRSTISGLTETFSPTYNPIKYPGRADQGYMYESFERTLTFNFKVYANSRKEMKNMWLKVQELAKLTLPDYSGGPYSGQLVFFRLGDLWGQGASGIPSIITALTYTYNDDHPWDLNYDGQLGELPMGVDVNISLTLLPGTAAGGRRYDVNGLALYSFNSEFSGASSKGLTKFFEPRV
jgi:hypothetical protein